MILLENWLKKCLQKVFLLMEKRNFGWGKKYSGWWKCFSWKIDLVKHSFFLEEIYYSFPEKSLESLPFFCKNESFALKNIFLGKN